MLLVQLSEYRGELDEDLETLRSQFEEAVSQERWEEAEEIQGRMKGQAPQSALTLMSEAELAVYQGRCEEARDRLSEKAQEMMEEGKHQEFLILGRGILRMGDECQAIREAMAEALEAEARAFGKYGLRAQALETVCDAVVFQPQHMDRWVSMASAMTEQGNGRWLLEGIEERVGAEKEKKEKMLLDKFLNRLRQTMRGTKKGGWPVIEEGEGGLGDQETSPMVMADAQPMVEDAEGPLLYGPRWVSNALELLRVIKGSDELTRVSLWEEESGELVGSFFASGGRLAVGVQMEGTPFDGGRRLEDKDKERLTELWKRFGVRSTTVNDRRGRPTVAERLLVEEANAEAIRQWSQIATGRRLRMSLKGMDKRQKPGLANRPRSLLMRLGRWAIEASASEPLKVGRHVEEASRRLGWLVRAEKGGGWLVWQYEGAESPRLEVLEALIEGAEAMEPTVVRHFPGSHESMGWALLSDEDAWGGFGHHDQLVLAQTPATAVGTLLRAIDRQLAREVGKK